LRRAYDYWQDRPGCYCCKFAWTKPRELLRAFFYKRASPSRKGLFETINHVLSTCLNNTGDQHAFAVSRPQRQPDSPILSMPSFSGSLYELHTATATLTRSSSCESLREAGVESVTSSFIAKSYQSSVNELLQASDFDRKVFRDCFLGSLIRNFA